MNDGIAGEMSLDLSNSILAGSFNGRQPDDGQEQQTDFHAALINGATTATRSWSGTNNLIQRNSEATDAAFTAAGIATSEEPDLDRLSDNGGPTQSFALNEDSPAIDAGTSSEFETDQRGLPRMVAAAPDIGAFEVQTVTPTVSIAPGATISEGLVEPDDFPSFQFTRGGDTSASLTINVTRSGSAGDNDFFVFNVAGGSYDDAAGAITFDPGATTVYQAIGPTQDGTAAEGDEAITFTVAAGAGPGGAARFTALDPDTGAVVRDEFLADMSLLWGLEVS